MDIPRTESVSPVSEATFGRKTFARKGSGQAPRNHIWFLNRRFHNVGDMFEAVVDDCD